MNEIAKTPLLHLSFFVYGFDLLIR